MFDIPIAVVDAAASQTSSGGRRFLGFVRDLTRYAATRDDAAARRAISSPYSGVPAADARALCVAASERYGLAATIGRETIPLGHESAVAARRFARALDELAAAYRAQGASSAEHVATIGLAFAGDGALDESERAAFEIARAIAVETPSGAPPADAWDAGAYVRALDRAASGIAAARSANEPRTPFARRAPEMPRPVKRRKTHFSASSLNTFSECERRWYFRYVCAAVEDAGSAASFYGTAFHWALERFHEEFPRADTAEPHVLERKLEGAINASFERYRSGFPTTVEYELQRRRAQRTAKRYLAWFVERARKHPFAVVGIEATVELELDGHQFIGYIDRLDRDDATGNITIVDYKTGNIAESAAEYRKKIAKHREFQLPFYYWAQTAKGDRVSRLSLVPLKDASRDVTPVELEVVPIAAPQGYSSALVGTIGIDELERARARMGEIAATLADAPLERFAATDDPATCTYCAYANACRDRPLASESRFGR